MSGYNYKIGVVLNSQGAGATVSDLGKVDAKLNSVGSSAKAAFAIFSGNLASSAFQKITSLAYDGGKALLDYSARMEQTSIAFSSLIGNAQKSEKHLADLKKFAIDTPFGFEGLAKSSQRLQGANVELAKIIPLMKDIGNIVAATGDTSEERLEGIVTAISQMIGKTKVSAEEMEQLSERGVQGWDILSKATGKSQAELRKLSEQGALSADVMVQSLQKIAREKYGDAMEKQSKTFNGAMSSIKDILMQTSATAFQPFYKEVSGMANRFSRDIQKQQGDMQKIGETIAKYLGEGLGRGLGAVLYMLGQYIGKRFKDIFTEGKIVDPITSAISKGVSRGITDGLGITTPEVEVKITSNQPVAPDPMLNMPGMVNPNQSGLVQIAQTPEMLEKQRKEREEALRKQREYLEKYNKLEIEATQNSFQKAQKYNEDMLEQEKTTFEAYQQATLANINVYQARVKKMMLEGYKASIIGKSKEDVALALLEYRNAVEKFDSEINDMRSDLAKSEIETQKKATEEKIKNADSENQRRLSLAQAAAATRQMQLEADLEKGLISEKEYAEEIGKSRLQTLEMEKAQLQESLTGLDEKSEKYADVTNQIRILDQKLSQQQISNAKAVEEAWKSALTARNRIGDEGEEGDPHQQRGKGFAIETDPFANWKTSWREFVEQMEQSVGITNIIDSIGGKIVQMGENMAQATGAAVEQWALYGDSIGLALKKALAAELAHIAGVATVNALYATALGFMRLAQWDFVGAGNAFMSAGLWAALAGGTALAAKAVAGDSFKQNGRGESNNSQPDYYTANPQNRIQTTSPNNPEYTAIFEGLRQEIARLQSMPPGDVVVKGIKERPGFISDTTINELNRNSSKATKMGKALRQS